MCFLKALVLLLSYQRHLHFEEVRVFKSLSSHVTGK